MKTPTPIEDIAIVVAYAELAFGYAKRGDVHEGETILLAMREALATRYDHKILDENVVKILEKIKMRASIHGSIPQSKFERQN